MASSCHYLSMDSHSKSVVTAIERHKLRFEQDVTIDTKTTRRSSL